MSATWVKTGWKAVVRGPRQWSPAVFFVYDVGILVGLLLIGPFHPVHWNSFGNPIPDVLPSAVPWAGALGGVCISLVGVAGHAKRRDWRPDAFGYWHLTRAALGAVFGSIAVLIITLLLQNVKQAVPGTAGFTDSGTAVLAVIAFTVGFREETFRSLIIRVVDIILGPSQNDSAVTYALVPAVVDFGTTKAETAVKASTHVFNGGKSTLMLTSADVSIQGDDTVVAALTPDPATLTTGESAVIDLTWTPAEAGALAATLQVNVPGTSISGSLTGKAT